MTTLQLWELAKRKGVAIVRTKANFLRIIKEKNLVEKLEQLKVKVLFDRMSELHISRLRSKDKLEGYYMRSYERFNLHKSAFHKDDVFLDNVDFYF